MEKISPIYLSVYSESPSISSTITKMYVSISPALVRMLTAQR